MAMFKFLPHTADIKMRVYGTDIIALFKNALHGMFSIMHTHMPVSQKTKKEAHVQSISLTAPTLDFLLIDFLSEALYLADVHKQHYYDVEISALTTTELQAILQGAPVQHYNGTEIKAVTYHATVITAYKKGWQTDILFDI